MKFDGYLLENIRGERQKSSYYECVPTASLTVERSPPRTEGCEFEPQPSQTKDLKNGNRYTQLSTKLESDIDKPERWLSSGQMLSERLLCSNGELNALGPPTQDPR